MMCEFISIEKASLCFTDLIRLLRTTDEIVITENQMPVARIVRSEVSQTQPTAKQTPVSCCQDTDHLGFKDYLP
jgi:antitoxin (DNA-binding transcriptional repressor) of toxin-antitoxin stability system